jgi:transposase
MGVHVAAIDIHKTVFQAAVLEAQTGEVINTRFPASREPLRAWAERWRGLVGVVAIEATTGWRWVARELEGLGFEIRLADPGRASALQGRRRQAKTDRLDARWLVVLLAREMLPEAWVPPAEIARLRDQTRLRKALADDHTRWAQRLHALLVHEGWPCSRGQLLSGTGRRWLEALALEPAARARVRAMLAVMATLQAEIEAIDLELRALARLDPRLVGLRRIYGVGPILACHLLAEIGEATRFRRARQVVRAAGLDPVVRESGEHRRRGRLAKQGSPHLRWALVEAAQHARRPASPDVELYRRARASAGANPATLTVARKIARRAFHVLREIEAKAA